jgi:uncharacterized protein (DUF3820 family)
LRCALTLGALLALARQLQIDGLDHVNHSPLKSLNG